MPQPFLFNLIDKAVFDYKLIQNADRILVGASGGKDSTALIEYFANRKKRPGSDFEFTALNVCTEFGGALPENIAALFAEWNVPLVTVNVDVQGRLKPGRKMSCYWCSTQRRTELIDYAVKNNFFGEKITVSGLITATDLMDQLAQRNLGEKVLIPCNMLRSGEDVFLDDLTVEDVRQALKTEVVVVDEPGADLVNCLIEAPDHKKIRRRQIYEQTGSSDSGQT